MQKIKKIKIQWFNWTRRLIQQQGHCPGITQITSVIFLVQLFGTWMLWKFGSFGMVVGLLPRERDLNGVALLAWRALLLSHGFAASRGLRTVEDVSFITRSCSGVLNETLAFLHDATLEEKASILKFKRSNLSFIFKSIKRNQFIPLGPQNVFLHHHWWFGPFLSNLTIFLA